MRAKIKTKSVKLQLKAKRFNFFTVVLRFSL